MVNRRASDAAPPATPIAPVVKRKRRASCLGEQERRERKRAIDREAQRSLREKTKTHIAELERTIQILKDQDRNGATSNLLSEIDGLRAENERLRDVIDSVKSVVGSEIFSRNTGGGNNVQTEKSDGGSPDPNTGAQQSLKARANSLTQSDTIPRGTSPRATTGPEKLHYFHSNNLNYHANASSRALDLDGMTVMADLAPLEPHPSATIRLGTISEIAEEGSLLDAPESPATASFAAYMDDFFGSSYFCPSPVVLHVGDPPPDPSLKGTNNKTICPIWTRSNELFGQVFSYRPSAKMPNIDSIEAGLLYQGIKEGWDSFSYWTQSPALKILKSVDEFLFCHLSKIERLAVAYKSFKLLRYYLNATKAELENVPPWLRPSAAQARTRHPIAVDFFAWPTVRSRLLDQHSTIFKTSNLSHGYSNYLRFEWPFSFEDAFFYDDMTHAYHPSPLFERYHRDLKYWKVSKEFSENCPELWRDIESDRRKYNEEVGS